MEKIVTVLGVRPQFIKASVVSAAINKPGQMKEVILHTGQHFDENTSAVFFTELGMEEPRYQLGIHGGNHGEMTGRMLVEIEKILIAEKPDAVLVYGDTNSTLAGALAAVKRHIPVAHVEAGLRSFNMAMPEEVNRILTDRISSWLFTPTDVAVSNLRKEGVEAEKIAHVGDVMYDAALHFGRKENTRSGILTRLEKQHGIAREAYCLATVHRAENTDELNRLAVIVDALDRFAEDLPVIWPLHPRTKGILSKSGMLEKLSRQVTLIDPLGYMDMVQLEKHAALIATDSGGVQKEAFFHRVPCVTLRGETEWTELVEAGWNRLAPLDDADTVLSALQAAIGSCGQDIAPYGTGDAAKRIVQSLLRDLV